ncbi:MAG: tetratricopeptide repeat protein [Acidobacteria bacterium]|nr:tetratricopeptide repeat protein [Acidobacteriota bacterium]
MRIHRLAATSLSLAVCALFAATVPFAADDPPPQVEGAAPALPEAAPRARGKGGSADARLQTLWFGRKANLETGDMVGAAGQVEAMTEIVRTERLDRVPWLARGFAYEGYEHLREGNYERARVAFDLARRFDHRMPEAQTGYAWAALKAGRGFGLFMTEYREGLRLRWQTFRREGAANASLVAAIALALAAVGIIGATVVRYQAMLRHDVAERMPAGWPDGASRLAGWIVLLAPLLAWFGGAWVLYYWAAILSRYMSGAERLLAAVGCVVLIAVGPLAAWGTLSAQIASDPTGLAISEALSGEHGVEIVGALQRTIRSKPEARALRLLLATTYERADMTREAFDEYHRLLELHPGDPRTLNNIGNLYMRTGQTPQAIVYYTKAAEADPKSAVFFYNLSIAQNESLRLTDAEASARTLQQLDPNLGRALMTARGRGDEIVPLPATATADEVRAEMDVESASAALRGSFPLLSPTLIGAVATILILLGAGLARSGAHAQTCIRCGEAFCGRCKRELGAKECCAQCIHLFVKREAIAAPVRARKLAQVERFARNWKRRVRLATILLPGAGHLIAGRTVAGAGLMLAWLVPLSALLFGRWLVLAPSIPVLDLPSITTLAAGFVMILLWSLANSLVPQPPR